MLNKPLAEISDRPQRPRAMKLIFAHIFFVITTLVLKMEMVIYSRHSCRRFQLEVLMVQHYTKLESFLVS